MKKAVITLIIALVGMVSLSSCDNYTARKFGGNVTIQVEPGYKVVEATWKDDGDLWYLIEPMEENYVPKTKKFVECSEFHVWEGTVIFSERR